MLLNILYMDYFREITYVLYSFKPPAAPETAQSQDKACQLIRNTISTPSSPAQVASATADHVQEPKACRNSDRNKIASIQEDPCPCRHRRY